MKNKVLSLLITLLLCLTFTSCTSPGDGQTYSITYYINDEIVEHSPSEYISGQIQMLIPFDDEAFIGWYDNSDFNGEAVEEISKSSTGDIVFYGKIGNELEVYKAYWKNIRSVKDFVFKYNAAHPNGYDLGERWCEFNSAKTVILDGGYEVYTTTAILKMDFDENDFNGKSEEFSIKSTSTINTNEGKNETTTIKTLRKNIYNESTTGDIQSSYIHAYANKNADAITIKFPFINAIFDIDNIENQCYTITRCDNVITFVFTEITDSGIKTSTYEYYFDESFNIERASISVTMTYFENTGLNSYASTTTLHFCEAIDIDINLVQYPKYANLKEITFE